MNSEKERRPFTFKLSVILMMIGILYLVSNLTFISYCTPHFYRSTEDSICQIAHSFRSISANIPVIARPVGFLKQSNQENRANVVEYDYLFSWGSAIIACLLMLLITFVMILTANADDRRELRIRTERARRLSGEAFDVRVKGIVALFLMASVYVFFDGFWGDFDFYGHRSLANLVHARDRDLYRVSVDLFLLLMFSTFFLVWGAKTLALKNATSGQ